MASPRRVRSGALNGMVVRIGVGGGSAGASPRGRFWLLASLGAIVDTADNPLRVPFLAFWSPFMSASAKRKSWDVEPHPLGGWQVRRSNGDRASRIAATKGEAVQIARELARAASERG